MQPSRMLHTSTFGIRPSTPSERRPDTRDTTGYTVRRRTPASDDRAPRAGRRRFQRAMHGVHAARSGRGLPRLTLPGELVTQRDVLEGDLAVAAAEEREEAKQYKVEQGADHRTAIVSGSELRDQPIICQTGFGEEQGARASALPSRPPLARSRRHEAPVRAQLRARPDR